MLHLRTGTVLSYPRIRTAVPRDAGDVVRQGTSTHSLMSEISHIPFRTDEFGMCGNINPPSPSDETRVPHVGVDQPCFARGGYLLECYKSRTTIVTHPSMSYPRCQRTNKWLSPRLTSCKQWPQ